MKTTIKRQIRKKGTQSQVKREVLLRKAIREMKRQSGEEFYFIEGVCFDYCC